MDSSNSPAAVDGADIGQRIPGPGGGDSGRRRRIPRGEVQRQAILDAFERCLREIPAVDISVKDITEAAGIKRPNFYFYFESKDEVLCELVGGAWDEWADSIGGYHRRAGESHADYFDRLFGTSYHAWVKRDRVMVAGMQAISYDQKLRARWTSLVTGLNRQLAAQMSRDADVGEITPLSDDHACLVTTLTDMIVMAFFKDRSLEPSRSESMRMLAGLKTIWLGTWGAPNSPARRRH